VPTADHAGRAAALAATKDVPYSALGRHTDSGMGNVTRGRGFVQIKAEEEDEESGLVRIKSEDEESG
jgi:hypothetical protein